MANTIQIDQLSQAIEQELTLYSTDVIEGVKKETKKHIKRLVDETKATAPVGNRNRHYKDNISSRKIEETERSVTYQWYVKGSDYRLSHLLNNGHALRNGGRYEGTKFISKAEVSIIEDYEKAIEEVCKNGK
jgi:hypothetical protein